ncbi:MAG: hypothetical protein J5724_03120 [Ruminococcus sp.]|nr:hypothetical protein [Ruminococcus sp.]
MTIVYKNELEAYNPDYEKSFFSNKNRAFIKAFEGETEYKTVSISVKGSEDTNTIIFGNGNISFRSCYEDDF